MMRRQSRHPGKGDAASAVLRKAARTEIILTHTVMPNGVARERFAYADGTPLPFGCKEATIVKMISDGRLIPIEGETLFGEATAAQRYRVRQPADSNS